MPQRELNSKNFHGVGIRLRKEIIESSLAGDHSQALKGLDNQDPRVRATSIEVLADNGLIDDTIGARIVEDPHPFVRMSAARSAGRVLNIPIDVLFEDVDFSVVEMSCWAAGERGDLDDGVVSILCNIVENHEDPLCREAAVAALGAIGSSEGLESILTATADIATVRRRAILALAPFDGLKTKEALEKALEDRDWQVRQAAEDLLISFND